MDKEIEKIVQWIQQIERRVQRINERTKSHTHYIRKLEKFVKEHEK
jgi:hypothetical protein